MKTHVEMIDPVVEEIHQIRQDLLREYGGMDGLVRALKKWEDLAGDLLVTDRQIPLPDLSKYRAKLDAEAATPPSPSA